MKPKSRAWNLMLLLAAMAVALGGLIDRDYYSYLYTNRVVDYLRARKVEYLVVYRVSWDGWDSQKDAVADAVRDYKKTIGAR